MKSIGEVLSNPDRVRKAAPASLPGTAEEVDAEACSICGGAGFVRRERPLDDPRFGRAEPCDCVLNESATARHDRLERISNLGALSRFTLDALDPDRGTVDVPTIQAARDYAAAPDGWLAVRGPSGAGKTHLAAGVANARVAAGEPALLWVVPDLLDALRASYRPDEGEPAYDDLFELVKTHPFLVLDDIDAASGTPWAREKLFQVVNHRYNLQLPTVFTLSGSTAVDERLASRFHDASLTRVIELAARPADLYAQVGGMTRERLAEFQFSDFAESSAWSAIERESFRSALVAGREYAEDPDGWLVIMGAHGCGKTHLAAAIAGRALRHGASVFFAVVPDLLDHLRASFAPTAEVVYDDLFDRVRNAGLLILDDLGAHKSSQWAEEKLYQIINYRTVSRLPTVVTTDLKPEGLQEVHPRIYARILDPHFGHKIEILAPHYALGRGPARPQTTRRPPR
ncbi:MAG: ATP-binding protein [Dehalococcoidia bacterium]|nr:ATP-binding protein [Dehalococcoidia bacterium]MCB9484760.1 ATP-binding protein [Thermoflexaceae bacterium]